jgi:NDP-sugar pyrophosphorylase family protein
MEFQAIVLAGGKGSRMNGLIKNTPKCLLPIGNKPMIWYPVRFLEKSGFTEIIIITLNSIRQRVEEELYSCGIRSRLNVIGFNDDYLESDDDFGTASALYLIKDKIFTDCIIVSCDLITNVNLQHMASIYRQNDASFLMLLYDIPEQHVEYPVPGATTRYTPGKFFLQKKFSFLKGVLRFFNFFFFFFFFLEIDYIGFDEKTNRLLYFNPDGEITADDRSAQPVKLKQAILKKY